VVITLPIHSNDSSRLWAIFIWETIVSCSSNINPKYQCFYTREKLLAIQINDTNNQVQVGVEFYWAICHFWI